MDLSTGLLHDREIAAVHSAGLKELEHGHGKPLAEGSLRGALAALPADTERKSFDAAKTNPLCMSDKHTPTRATYRARLSGARQPAPDSLPPTGRRRGEYEQELRMCNDTGMRNNN